MIMVLISAATAAVARINALVAGAALIEAVALVEAALVEAARVEAVALIEAVALVEAVVIVEAARVEAAFVEAVALIEAVALDEAARVEAALVAGSICHRSPKTVSHVGNHKFVKTCLGISYVPRYLSLFVLLKKTPGSFRVSSVVHTTPPGAGGARDQRQLG